MEETKTVNIFVIWRGEKLNVEINSGATLKEFGHKLQNLTNVKSETLRLLIPKSSDDSAKLLTPFSDDHSSLSLKESSILEGKSLRMMGVFEDEIKEVTQKADLRIAGFEEEEKRLRKRMLSRPMHPLKLPGGTYIFCDFRTLQLPGIELKPPASEALKRMHMLAADPGIVAIMNKHRWRVGIMTEMAPEGYVGVSPECILGFNKNKGEEISLRLRTDDLKGFRKYQSIKKTLLHELAHMVYSEHNADFKALDSQLNQEAASLDWTRSRGQTLSGHSHRHSHHFEEDEEEFYSEEDSYSQKLGGDRNVEMDTARSTSVAAAYRRLVERVNENKEHEFEPDPDDSVVNKENSKESCDVDMEDLSNFEESSFSGPMTTAEPDPDDNEVRKTKSISEPDPDAPMTSAEPDPDDNEVTKTKSISEPDPDDTIARKMNQAHIADDVMLVPSHEPDPDESNNGGSFDVDPNNQELKRIQDPVSVICTRLQKTIETLKSEVNPIETTSVLQTLFKIIRNVIEHPDEAKFRRLRKANPHFQKTVARYRAAMELLFLVGFNEDTVWDEIGRSEIYVVLKRNDPGLLWLAKSSLETCIAY
ncbi:hypothetical protein ACHQM5_002686 [Ranunculus cassubicifolius]